MKKHPFNLLFVLLLGLFLTACSSVKYYYNETENEVYTELQLNKDGTFKEYIYFSLGDSLVSEDFGNLITGTYSYAGDTLQLTYDMDNKKNVNEIYLKNKKELSRLQPVTYSLNFVNNELIAGKSKKLRDLANYDVIQWKSR